MVFKAKVKDGKTYYLCARRERVDSTEYIEHRKNGTLPETAKLLVFVSNNIVRIPKPYKEDFDETLYINKRIISNKYRKEMCPDVLIAEKPLIGGIQEDCNWLVAGSTGLCTKDMLLSSTGSWSIDKNKVIYRYEHDVKVLREGSIRHKKDKEYEELVIDLNTGKCVLTQHFFNGVMSTNKFTFNKSYRVWVLISTKIDQDIIGIKR